jgi:DNA-binding transcriptional LysR family regulator
VPPAPVVCGSVMAIRELLRESDFLTMLSPHQIRSEQESGALVVIGGPIEETRRPIGLTVRAGWRPTPAQSQFLELLRKLTGDTTLQGIE